jgi:hypothetical protein
LNPEPCNGYVPETEVELTAVPDEGYRFVEWRQYLDGENDSPSKVTRDNPTTVTMDADMEVRAVFRREQKTSPWIWVGIGFGVVLAAAGLTYLTKRRGKGR